MRQHSAKIPLIDPKRKVLSGSVAASHLLHDVSVDFISKAHGAS